MNLFKNQSIKLKMILIIQIVSLFSLLIGFSYMIVRNIADYKEDLKNNAIINANLIGEYCATPLEFDESAYAIETLEKLRSIPSIDAGIVFNKADKVFAEFYAKGKKSKHVHPNLNRLGSYYDSDYLHVFQTIMYEKKIAGTIYLKVSTTELKAKINNYLMATLFLLILIIILNYFLAVYLQRIVSVPIVNLTTATKKISKDGDYRLRVEKRGNDEIGLLVDEYNNMLEQIYVREESLKLRTNELTKTLADLKETQHRLISSERLAALGQLIAGVGHEINTPLGAIRSSIGNIKNSLKIILEDYPEFVSQLSETERVRFFSLIRESIRNQHMFTSKEERSFKNSITITLQNHGIENAYSYADTFVDMMVVENIEKYLGLLRMDNAEVVVDMAYKITGVIRSADNIDLAAARASKVVFALKNSSRIGNFDEKILANITDGIESVLTLYNNQIKQGIEVSKKYKDIPKIYCYFDELNQVWTNILHNAIYAMDLNGNLEIKTYTEDECVVVSITDSGKGIPPDEIGKIFDPFFSTKSVGEGTGIGLDIAKRIIDKHNGKIIAESIPGKTTFRVYLPMETKDSASKTT